MDNWRLSRAESVQSGGFLDLSRFFLYNGVVMIGLTDSESPRHSIGIVARSTGLKPDLIRAWERRYGAVEPARTDTRRRLYSDAEVQRLQLLCRAVEGGRGIGTVAHLPDAELRELIASDLAVAGAVGGSAERKRPERGRSPAEESAIAEVILQSAMAAVQHLDGRAFDLELERASVKLSRAHLIEKVLEPLMRTVGELWRSGELRPAHEHMASAGVRSFVGGLCKLYEVSAASPRIVVTTPRGQRHETGALLVAASACAEGWNVLYLGPDLPAEEIAAAALGAGARVVALSITYPPDDPAIVGDLAKLGRLLPERATLLVGGRSAAAYRGAIGESGGRLVDGLGGLRDILGGLRSSVPDK